MSTDVINSDFTLTGENPERGSKLTSTPNVQGEDDVHSNISGSSGSSGRSRGGRRRNRRSPRTSSPSPSQETGDVQFVVGLTGPTLEPVEKISDLVDRALREEGPLVQNSKPEVKDDKAVDDVVMAGLAFKLPSYSESWKQFDDLSEDTQPLLDAEGRGYYYRSASGLCAKEIRPFFMEPIAMIANSRTFYWHNMNLHGRGCIKKIKMPSRELLTENAAKAVSAECVLRAFTKLDPGDDDRKRYFRNLKVLRFYMAVWDSLMFSYQLVRSVSVSAEKMEHNISWRVNSDLRRQIERFRVRLLSHPYREAKKLKELAGHARAWFFGGPKPRQALVRTIPSKYYALMFSYLGRALPPQARSDVLAGYDGLVKRLTSNPPPEVKGWREFIVRYLEKYRPKDIEHVSYPTDSSAAASLGYTRVKGGFSRAVQDLVGIGLSLMKVRPRGTDVLYSSNRVMFNVSSILVGKTGVYKADFQGHETEEDRTSRFFVGRQPDLDELNSMALLQSLFSLALRRAVEWVFERFERIPFVALSAPEPGLKTRYPTISPAAVTLVSQILRRAADSHLLMDPRCRESLGGKPEIRLGKQAGPWYSQDLTSATDLHPFWLQRTFYEEVLARHPKIDYLGKHLNKLFGPRKLIAPKVYEKFLVENLETPTNPFTELLEMEWEKVFPNLEDNESHYYNTVDVDEVAPRWEDDSDLEDEDPEDLVPFFETDGVAIDQANEHIREWEEWWQKVDSLEFTLTSTGNPMGEAASFPVMPLVTTFSAERAGLPLHGNTGDDARIPLGQKGIPAVLAEMPDDRSSKMNGLLSTLPPDSKEWGAEERLSVLELSLLELGAVLSRGDPREGKPNKIFLHPKYSLYKEIPMVGDHRIPFIPTKLLSAPPGGAKGSISWFNQPTAVLQHCAEFQFRLPKKLWRKLPYWNETQAAFSYGIPVRECVAYGGVNHPCFPHTAGLNPRTTQRWLSSLSSLTLIDWATGTGLSPLPAPTTLGVRSAAKGWLKTIVLAEKSAIEDGRVKDRRLSRLGFDPNLRGPLPSLKEAVEEATRYASSYMLYGKGPVEFLHTPSIMTVSHKFHRNISRGVVYLRKRRDGSLGPLNYADTMLDVSSKNSVYLLEPDELIPGRRAARGYGLQESKFDPSRKPWRWDWLERGTSDPMFVNAFAQAVVGVGPLPTAAD